MSHEEANLRDKKQTCKNVLQKLIQVSFLVFIASLTGTITTVMCHFLCSSPGLQPVQVWPDEDLLPSRSGSLSGEVASGSTSSCLCDHSETLTRMEPQDEVPEDEGGSHHHSTVHPREEDNSVRPFTDCTLQYCCYFKI